MFYQLLKSGKSVTIKDKKGLFTSTKFYCVDGLVHYDNDEIGYKCKHDLFIARPNQFNEHINNMLEEGLQIIIE